jgi:hypothetical protein
MRLSGQVPCNVPYRLYVGFLLARPPSHIVDPVDTLIHRKKWGNMSTLFDLVFEKYSLARHDAISEVYCVDSG